jgi:pimeloyl-ACP methyl ester carboxylesterase
MKILGNGPISRRQFLPLGLLGAAQLATPANTWPETKRRNFVLVHGAWHGGWCWRRVADRLTAKGHHVITPTLSGVGGRYHLPPEVIDLTTHINDVVGETKWRDLEDIVLVGHSYAGMVITGVAEQLHERISAIVYLDAFLPSDGQSLTDFSSRKSWPEPVTPAPPASVFHVNAKDEAWVNSKLTPQSTRCFTENLKVTGAYQTIPKKLYVRSTLFPMKAFDQALARCRADRTWQTITIASGHDVMIDRPAELTAMLERLA